MTQQGHLRRDRRSWRLVVRLSDEPGGPRRPRSIRLGSIRELPRKCDAEAAADRWRLANLSSQLHAGMSVRWADWCERFVHRHLITNSRATVATQRAIVRRHLQPFFEAFEVHRITDAMVQLWVSRQIETGASPRSIAARFAVLRRMLRVAAAEGLAATAPTATKIRLPAVQTVTSELRRKAFAPAEATRIIAAAPQVDAVAYATALYLGLRAGELVGLTWWNVNLTTGTIEVRAQAVDGQLRTLKTRSSRAVLQAPQTLLECLKAFREVWVENDGQFLFADASGRPWRPQALRDRLRLLLDQLGIERRGLHGFRHALAFALADAGTNPEVIRRAMRHSSLRVTAAYLHAAPEDVAAGLERAANHIGRHAEPSPRAQP